MRLSLFAMALALAALAGVTSAEARPYYGNAGYGRAYAHANWGGARYAQRSYGHRQYAQRSYGRRYAQRSYSGRSYAQRAYSGRSYAQRAYSGRYYAQRRYGSRTYASAGYSGAGGRPRAWCGWWMRTQLGGGPEYNLAANWRNYGHSTTPQVGAVVVWPHHVGIITGQASNGQWIVKSGNDGNAVRERAQSVAGAVFRMG